MDPIYADALPKHRCLQGALRSTIATRVIRAILRALVWRWGVGGPFPPPIFYASVAESEAGAQDNLTMRCVMAVNISRKWYNANKHYARKNPLINYTTDKTRSGNSKKTYR